MEWAKTIQQVEETVQFKVEETVQFGKKQLENQEEKQMKRQSGVMCLSSNINVPFTAIRLH